MILDVKVVPGAKKNLFKQEAGQIKIYLTAPPLEGKANALLVRFLAEHFNVRKQDIEIIKGLKSRRKTINIKSI